MSAILHVYINEYMYSQWSVLILLYSTLINFAMIIGLLRFVILAAFCFFYVKRYRHSYFCLNDRFVASIDYRVGLLLMPYCFGVPSYRVMIQLLYCIFLQSLYFRLTFLFCSLCCDSRWHCHHEINRLSYDNKLTLNTSPVLKFRLIDAILSDL